VKPIIDEVSDQAEDTVSPPNDTPGRGEGPGVPETPSVQPQGDALDMSNPGDRYKLARAIRNSWQIDPDRKRRYFEALDEIVANLHTISDPAQRAKAATQAARVLIAEQGQALRDIHHRERLEAERGILDLKISRAEGGKPNDCVSIVTPVRELPLPAAFAGMRKRILEPGAN
jgi:hypothetical protein